MHGRKKTRKHRNAVQVVLFDIAFYLELVVAFIVIIVIACQIAGLFFSSFHEPEALFQSEKFTHFLELCLNTVIGIEFLKILCRHNMEAVIEVLLFAMARHLIISAPTMPDNLLYIIAIAILFGVRRFFFVAHVDLTKEVASDEEAEEEFEEELRLENIKEKQSL